MWNPESKDESIERMVITRGHFEDFDNFFEYLKGSGNKLDFTINFCFGIALICRISSWMMAARYKQTNGVDQLDGNELCKISSACVFAFAVYVQFSIPL